ncbi:hypothetical protein P43SY_007647 [Pythium insidiosum]|uniref:Uncharacterized protein n=1 Tax=Pythium insidiosum TaxID=114742 RepID=A0AAD5QCI6_PYTIN|nr:hypothetical protein P43SY_007647 [Pythium insidiosum]
MRLRPMKGAGYGAASTAIGRAAAELACKIADADDWTTIEGYREHRLDEALGDLAATQRATTRAPPRRPRPRRGQETAALTDEPTADDIEDQLRHVSSTAQVG